AWGSDEEIFAFEYAKNVYSFPGRDNIYGRILILEDTTVLMAGRYATDSINPGVEGYRHLIRIDSIGDPVEGFPDIICEPWSSVTYDIRRANEGKYWLAGEFHLINGHNTNSLARLNADFTVDTTYVSPFLDSDGRAFISQIDSDGNIWIRCDLGCNIPTGSVEDRTLMKLTSEGEIDANFNIPDAYTYFDGESDEVFRLPPNIVFEDTDGNFIVGGNIMLYNGVPVKRIFMITPNGDLIPEAFENLGADEAEWDGWTFDSEYAEVMINNILRQPDGKLLVGGAFSSFGGEPYSCLVRLEQDGFVSTENHEKNDFEVRVWPNPAKGLIHLQTAQPILKMEIISLEGKLLFSKKKPQVSEAIALPTFISGGIYLIRFLHLDGFSSTQKIVIK
ncbi:MAG: T9SS type A sorting domain-containing protein, partial [Cryomorphaceae bacterium]